MGLLENVINAVTHSGGSQQATPSSGMSPLTKALLMLLAAKAAGSYLGRSSSPAAAPTGSPSPSGKIESGILAGMPNLDSILDKLRSLGHGDAVNSWVGHGDNKPVPAADLGSALGSDTVSQLERESGMPRDQLLGQLSQVFPQVVDKLSPEGRLPGAGERSHW